MGDGKVAEFQTSGEEVKISFVRFDSEFHPFFDVVVLFDLPPGLLEGGGHVLEKANVIIYDMGLGIDVVLDGF